MRLLLIFLFLLSINRVRAQSTEVSAQQQEYLSELKIAGKEFTADFYPNYAKIHSLPEKSFTSKIDSVRKIFTTALNKHRENLDPQYVLEQQLEIRYYFDKLLAEYLVNHEIYTGKPSAGYSIIPGRLKKNLADFNKPELLTNTDFTSYLKAFLSSRINIELKRPVYKTQDNKQLNAAWKLIPTFISNQQCKEFWQFDYLYSHIDNNGIKNIQTIYRQFESTCKNADYRGRINTIYSEDSIGRKGHLISSYKTVGPFQLDLHLFLPDSLMNGNKRPVIIYFHGGSWSEGKPDWFFNACENYAKKGWLACAVEYRTYGRHGTLPFDAVMDAKSAIRWLRQNANKYNIDPDKIVASGNSAGGHLILAAALADKWNEKTDNPNYSPAPNLLLVNSGVYDLTDRTTAWIRKDLKDKNMVKEISPVYLIKKNMPPTLIIHGTADKNVPYSSAKLFVDEMLKAGNKNIEFQPLNGAGHFIWFDATYSPEVARLRADFLTKSGF